MKEFFMGGPIRKIFSTVFLAFSTKKRDNFDYKVFDHGGFNDEIYNLCTTTQGYMHIHALSADRRSVSVLRNI